MSAPCPGPEVLDRLEDGELTENHAAAVREHAATCSRCQAALARRRGLVARLAAPIPGAAPDGGIAALLARLDMPAPPAPRRTAWRLPAAVAAAASVAVAAGALLARERAAREDAGFAPRGAAGGEALRRTAALELWTLERPPRVLRAGLTLPAGTAVVGRASNLGAAPVHVLAFALDAGGEVLWLYPAYADPAADPAALRVDPGARDLVLPEAVALDGTGPTEVVIVTSPVPLRVSDVERLAPGSRTPAALRARWPAAGVEALDLRLEPSAGSHP